jgi:adenylyltransferase/sulfurtransferase
VVDCTDNPETRYLVNRICHQQKVPLVFAGAVRTDGQVTCFVPDTEESPCLRCIFPQTELDYDQAPSCSVAGVLGSTTLIIGALQTAEVIKLLTQSGTALIGRLLLYDGLSSRFTEINVRANPDCPVCGKD